MNVNGRNFTALKNFEYGKTGVSENLLGYFFRGRGSVHARHGALDQQHHCFIREVCDSQQRPDAEESSECS